MSVAMVGRISFTLTFTVMALTASQPEELCDDISLLQKGSSINAGRGAALHGSTERSKPEGNTLQNTTQNTTQNASQSVSPIESIERKEEKIVLDPASNASLHDLLKENADLKLKIRQLQAYIDPTKAINEAFFAFTNGHFNGSRCRHVAAKYYTEDVVIDFRGPRDTEFFKRYGPGLDGACEYFKNAYDKYAINDLQFELHRKGARFGDVWKYTPGLPGKNGKQASGRITQFNVISLNEDKTKISRLDAFFDKPSLYDELKLTELQKQNKTKPLKTPQMMVAAKLFSAFANGKLLGSTCKPNAAATIAADALIDSRLDVETDFFKMYRPSLDGVCEYFGKAYTSAMHNLNASMYARGDDVVLVLNYVPGVAGLQVRGSQPITQFDVISFDKNKSKAVAIDMFYDNSWVFEEVYSAPETQAALRAFKTRAARGEQTHTESRLDNIALQQLSAVVSASASS